MMQKIAKKLQSLDILTCNSVNKPFFQILTKISLHFVHLRSIGQKGLFSDFENMVF